MLFEKIIGLKKINISKLILKGLIAIATPLFTLSNMDNREYSIDRDFIENNLEEQNKWKIGGKIHFEEKSSSDYLGTIEINKLTRKALKQFFDIKTDSCDQRAKVLIKKETDNYILSHYEERNSPSYGEEMHATLLYTSKRVDNGHETLKDVYQNLLNIDQNLPSDRAPSVEEIAQAYNMIIKPDWKFKISDITFVKGKTGSCIIAKLLYDERDEIVNKQGDPISGNFLHMSLVNIDFSISLEDEKIKLVVNKLKEELVNKTIKIADIKGEADLEFGVTGSKPQDRIRPTNKIKLDVPYISKDDNYTCATTSLAMAISYLEKLDKPLDKDFIWNISGSNVETIHMSGNDMEGLKKIADHYGYKSEFRENMRISDVEKLLSQNTLVLLNIKFNKTGSITHTILITGYDSKKKIFYINDASNSEKKIIKYSDLETRWSAHLSFPYGMFHRSGFVVYPKKLNELEKQIKVFVFDFDDTLTKKGSMEAVFQILKETLLIDSDELLILLNEYKASLTQGCTTKEQFWLDYASSKNIRLTKDFVKSIEQALDTSIQWDPQMFSLVNKIKEQGYKVVLFSDIEKDRADQAKKEGLFDVFDDVIFTYEIGYDKPHPKAYEYLLSKIQLKPNECIFIDDAEENIKAAIEQNIHGIVFESYDDLKTKLDKYYIKNKI